VQGFFANNAVQRGWVSSMAWTWQLLQRVADEALVVIYNGRSIKLEIRAAKFILPYHVEKSANGRVSAKHALVERERERTCSKLYSTHGHLKNTRD
jgi:hypothetical protein